jgi:hypothetical protein
MTLTTTPGSFPHGERPIFLYYPSFCGEWCNQQSHGDGWCDVGISLLVCVSKLHVLNLRYWSHHLISYPLKWGIMGHVLVPSFGGYLYYVSFIDDFSMNTWILFLRKKSEASEKFKEFKSLV